MISVRDQSSFLSQAKPPNGYQLTYCVGTTFSLDLECLLQLALNSRCIDTLPRETNELAAFAALEAFQTKAIVFCQNCRIKESHFLSEEVQGSKRISQLLAALDSSVVAVPAPSFKSAFHPKAWLFRYDGDLGKATPLFTLLVQSRNLTASKDWDITSIFRGSLQSKSSNNQSLINFFSHLHKVARPSRKQKLVQRAMDDLTRIRFDSIPEFSEHWDFLFQWPKEKNGEFLDPSNYRELIAVSPFLGKTVTTLKGMNSVPKFTLIIGPKDIATINRLKGLAQHTFVMAGSNEGVWNAAGSSPDQLGLHAKIYIGLLKDSDEADFFIGSANLTDAGFGNRNCEAMVRLRCGIRQFRDFETEFIYKDRKKQILHPWLQTLEGLLFAQGEPQTVDDASAKLLEELRSRISQGSFQLRFPKRNLDAVLRFSIKKQIELLKGVESEFRMAGSARPFPLDAVLRGAEQTFLAPRDERTEFLIIRLKHGNRELRFVTIASSDLNRSARSRARLNHIVKDDDTFFELLGLMLGVPIQNTTTGNGHSKDRNKAKPKPDKLKHRASLRGKAFLEPLLLRGLMDLEREAEINSAIQAFLTARRPASQKKAVAQFSTFWIRYCKASAALRRHE